MVDFPSLEREGPLFASDASVDAFQSELKGHLNFMAIGPQGMVWMGTGGLFTLIVVGYDYFDAWLKQLNAAAAESRKK